MALSDRELKALIARKGWTSVIYEQQASPVCPLCAIVLVPGQNKSMLFCTNCRFEITESYLDRFRGTMQRGEKILARNTPPVQTHKMDGEFLKRVDKSTRIITLEDDDKQ